MTPPVRVWIADDHPVVREGVATLLEHEPGFAVAGQSAGGRETLAGLQRTEADVLLLDLEMPDGDGLDVLRALGERDDPPRVVVFTAYDTDDRIVGAVEAGAAGYLLKGAPRAQLFAALRTVAGGGTLFPPLVAERLARHLSRRRAAPRLTPRETDVLGLIAEGLLNKEIADRLAITERTVKYHVGSLLAKLEAGNRTEAVARAVEWGLLAQRGSE